MTILTAEQLPEDDLDRSLRPRRLEDFIGQDALKDQLPVSIAAAASHVTRHSTTCCLRGRPGWGRPSLAQIIAAELGVPFIQTAGPALRGARATLRPS